MQTLEEKRKTAELIAVERAKRTPQEQLKLLDKRLGKNVGAKKERAQLVAQIEQSSE